MWGGFACRQCSFCVGLTHSRRGAWFFRLGSNNERKSHWIQRLDHMQTCLNGCCAGTPTCYQPIPFGVFSLNFYQLNFKLRLLLFLSVVCGNEMRGKFFFNWMTLKLNFLESMNWLTAFWAYLKVKWIICLIAVFFLDRKSFKKKTGSLWKAREKILVLYWQSHSFGVYCCISESTNKAHAAPEAFPIS